MDTDKDGEIEFHLIFPYIKDSFLANPDGKRYENVLACTDSCTEARDYPDCYAVINQTKLDPEILCST